MSIEAIPKLQHAAQYVICHTEPSQLGATKLNKVLWFADVFHYQQHGTTVTGLDSYQKKKHGPVPQHIQFVLGRLKALGRIEEHSLVNFYAMKAYKPLAQVDLNQFSESEIDALQEAINYVVPMTASQASEVTHTPYWDEVPMNGQMAIGPASVRHATITDADLQWALQATSA